ncbi:class I SAM-dependent methyltransferase [Actinoplanes cyaneus]|nr:class I SAM-dependent methyltransferase [Actinoplanes cyaneus]MCW2137861.1 Methyltransferase domain-containing protein [Actinoplanes cyaneus]
MEPILFKGPLAHGYERGRRLPDDAVDSWMRAARRNVPPGHAEPVLDLGAGTGRFSAALALTFGVPVTAVEPSADMRAVIPRPVDARVHLVGGRAEAIPCRDGLFQAVWASQVAHHIVDFDACAAELRRVLRPGGRVLLRGGFHDEDRPPPLHHWFPGLRRLAGEGSSALAALSDALDRVGLREQCHEVIPQVSAASLADLLSQVELRARSPLRRLSDQEFADGLGRLRAAVAAENEPRPVVDQVDLVVFG